MKDRDPADAKASTFARGFRRRQRLWQDKMADKMADRQVTRPTPRLWRTGKLRLVEEMEGKRLETEKGSSLPLTLALFFDRLV